MTAEQAEEFVEKGLVDQEDIYNLGYALKAIKKAWTACTLFRTSSTGGILGELFTHDGVGTLITEEHMESMKTATIDDLQGLIKLLQPLEEDGTLVKRPRKNWKLIFPNLLFSNTTALFTAAPLYMPSRKRKNR